jgi:histidine ammonia-lyase
LKSSAILEAAHDFVRDSVSFASEDRIFAEDIVKLRAIIRDFSFVKHCDEYATSKGVLLNQGSHL